MQNEKKRLNMFERFMLAVTFAEAGDRDTALSFVSNATESQKQKRKKTCLKCRTESRPSLMV